jgi:hypothetical protein
VGDHLSLAFMKDVVPLAQITPVAYNKPNPWATVTEYLSIGFMAAFVLAIIHTVSFIPSSNADALALCGANFARYPDSAQNGDWLEFRCFCETSCLSPILFT